jgi:hypothetical protein
MHANPMGISGSGAQVWVHLTECFWRIDKPAVALKCFNKALEEISATSVQPLEFCEESKKLLEIIEWEKFELTEEEKIEDPIF